MSCMLPGIPVMLGLQQQLAWHWWRSPGNGAETPLETFGEKCVCVVYIHTCTNLSFDNRTQTHTFWSKFEKSNILHEPPKHAKPPKPSFSKFSDFKAMVKADPGLSSGKMPMFDDQIGCHIFLQSNSGSVHGACFLHVADQV